MKSVNTPTMKLLLLFLLLTDPPSCPGQDQPTSFFGPDETGTQKALVVQALKLVCPQGELLQDDKGNPAGCRHCPDDTTDSNLDADTLKWDLTQAFTGHFTSAQEENLVLSGRGCEPHASNTGGTFVFAVKDSVVSLLDYNRALITEGCHRFQLQNLPDMLVCTDDWGRQDWSWSYVYSVRFDRVGESKVRHIFEVIDRSKQHCGMNFFDDSPTTVEKSEITALEAGHSEDGAPTLLITATLGERNPTPEERKACDEEGKPIPLALNTYHLKFIFNGGVFQPTSDTADLLKLFPKPETPDQAYSPDH